MTTSTIQEVAELVVRRAQRQGYVVARDVREELTSAGLDEGRWKEAISLAGDLLRLKSGRYYYSTPVTSRVKAEQSQQQTVQEAVRELVKKQEAATARRERRGEERHELIQPVKVVCEDGREFTLLTRDLSSTGIRLIGTRRLLGQKVRVLIPGEEGTAPFDFTVRILWTCPVGDDLVENGGSFLSVSR